MEERHHNKSSSQSDVSSPVLLRRRLSAPETIMRKHMLAQQRSDSQDSDATQNSDVRSCQWGKETGSDLHLNKKRNHGLMLKSSLMRRLWGSNKPLSERSSRFSGSYSEWQYGKVYQGRSTQHLGSAQSSPEHIMKHRNRVSLKFDDFANFPQKASMKKTSTNNKLASNRIYNDLDYYEQQKIASPEGNSDVQSGFLKTSCCSNQTYATNFEKPSSSMGTAKSTMTTTTLETESEHYSTRSTSTTGATAFSENSDSAYTNGNSNFTQSSYENSVGTTTYSSERFLEENGNIVENEDGNEYRTIKERTTSNKNVILDHFNDSSTQTNGTANLNVISNIQLSQSTLNLIFNQVMLDVQNTPSSNINISTLSTNFPLDSNLNAPLPQTKLVQPQQVPSFYLNQKDKEEAAEIPIQDRQCVLKYVVGNVGTGSPYSKPNDIPQVVVPRFSALPRTASMEVNASSSESTDKESDISLVDSLEDPNSPRMDVNQNKRHDDKLVRGDLSPLLPDNSNTKSSNGKNNPKASVFFIPIKTDNVTDVKSVADHLPDKVRERLSKRQLRREQKLKQSKDKAISPKSDSNYVSASDNGNQVHYTIDTRSSSSILPDIDSYKSKRKNKPLLPSISTLKKVKGDFKEPSKYSDIEKRDKNISKSLKRKTSRSQDSNLETYLNDQKRSNFLSKTHRKMLEQFSPLHHTTEYPPNVLPKRIYHKTELTNSNKRIEILEIVECIERTPLSRSSKKSKIPVLVQSKLPSISKDDRTQKPVFLDFEQMQEAEPKIDQLIANILIDALNKSDNKNGLEEKRRFPNNISFVTEKRPSPIQSPHMRHQNNKYQQTFDAIPEEKSASLQSSSEDASNTDNNDSRKDTESEKILKSETQANRVKRSSNRNSTGGYTSTKSTNSDGYKGKASLGVIKDENFSTIPKGWITFYTLHKSQGSPESTSDEGKKKIMANENANCSNILKDGSNKWKKQNPENRKLVEGKFVKGTEETNTALNVIDVSPENTHNYMIPTREDNLSEDSIDNWTNNNWENRKSARQPLSATDYVHKNQHRKGRVRNSPPSNKIMPDGWTVTVSGTTSGAQFAPDLEMRLTFPHGSKQNLPTSHNSSTVENKTDLVKEHRTRKSASKTKDIQLPQIIKDKTTTKLHQCENSRLVNVKDSIEPRQTRTSSRRLLLNRPRTFITPVELVDINKDNYNFKQMLAKFPDILQITGNAVSPRHKPHLTSMSARDVTRYIYHNN